MNIIFFLFFSGICIMGMINSINQHKKIEIYSYLGLLDKIVLIVFPIVLFYIIYKVDGGLAGIFLAVLGYGYIFLMGTATGLSREGIVFINRGNIRNHKLYPYEDFRVIKLDRKKKYLRLEAPSPKGLAILKFRQEDENKILSIITNVRVEER